MIIIKLFDKNQTENIGSTLALQPERTVFAGSGGLMKLHGDVYENMLRRRSIPTVLEYVPVDELPLPQRAERLYELLKQYPGAEVDLTGGDDLTLAAAGMALQRMRCEGTPRASLRYDARTGIVTDCDGDGEKPRPVQIAMTVAENIALRGGCIRRFEEGADCGTEPWPSAREFGGTVSKMWKICRRNPARWNTVIGSLPGLEARTPKTDPLKITLRFPQKYEFRTELTDYLRQLEKAGAVTGLTEEEDVLRYRYANPECRRALRKAGTVHELKMLYLAAGMKNPDGTGFFNDAVNGVYIDWDGVLHSRDDPEKDTANEIDVLLTHGMMPVFVSCKNGNVPEDELYKLFTVADRFGGKFARKILTATFVGKKDSGNAYLRTRAADMGILLIENVHKMTDAEIEAAFRSVFDAQNNERTDNP